MIRRKKKNLISIAVIIALLLITSILIIITTRNNVHGAPTNRCSYGHNNWHLSSTDNIYEYYYCVDCFSNGINTETQVAHDFTTTFDIDESTHREVKTCNTCGKEVRGNIQPHVWDANNYMCTICQYINSTPTVTPTPTTTPTPTVTPTPTTTPTPTPTTGECPAGGDHNLGSYQVYYGSSTQHGRICSKCSQWVVIENHNWSEWLDSGDGSHCYRECESNCGVSNQTQSHTIVTLPGRDATCTTSGLTTGSQCTSCHVLLQEQETIPALGHSWNSGTITTAATCTTAGVRTYTCSRCSATKTETIPATGHTGATHSNGGKCTVCGEVYQTHSKGTTIKSYTKTSTTHTPVYACTYSGCTGTFNGTAENHTFGAWTDNNDGTTHSRTCTACGEVQTNNHYDDDNDGICDACGHVISTTPTPTPSNPTPTPTDPTPTPTDPTPTPTDPTPTPTDPTPTPTDPTPTPTDPTPTPTDPTPTPSNPTPTPEHTTDDWTPWTDNGDGTHSRECTECDEEETKPHNFENGKCTECGATDPNANNGNSDENCTHPEDKRKWKSDENEHWQECGECGEEIPGTRGKHNYQDGKCKNCGREEKDTTSKTTIPNTGIGTMVFAIVGLMGLVTFGAIKVRKYKDIK